MCAPSRRVGGMLPQETWISTLSEMVSDALGVIKSLQTLTLVDYQGL